jgi:asparagine synthase (glutamine-hydrolysing)
MPSRIERGVTVCGVAGLIGPPQVTSSRLTPMLDVITHRGPDDSGEYVGPHFAFGMRRLSIIDIAGGHQPMWSADGRYGIVYNGEIYNFAELREELEAAGHTFQTRSDTEVVLQWITHHGLESAAASLSRLRGMFGFSLVDLHDRRMLIARDHFGIKPMYISTDETGERIQAFASEIKSILADPDMPRRVHWPALVNYLSFQYNPLEKTFFEGIVKLPPGHFLDVDLRDRSFTRHCYYRYEFDPASSDDVDVSRTRIREVLEDSVSHHVISDVPVGAFLSGGIDSAITVTLVQEQRRHAGVEPVKTFTIGFDEVSELAEAREVADALGTDHHEIVISSDEYLSVLPAIAWAFDEPVADPSAVALYFLARAAREHVTVVLSGEGADELFGGYRIYREPIDLDRVRRIPAGIGVRLARMAVKTRRSFPGRNYLRRVITPLGERFIGNAYVFRPDEVRRLLPGMTDQAHIFPADVLADQRPGFDQLPESRRMQLIDLEYWLRGDILAKADRMTMAHSLELRVPYLDIEVAGVSARLSDDLKYRDGTSKWILRRAFRGRVPSTTEVRDKLGFPTPLKIWLSRDPDAVMAPIRRSRFINDHMNTEYIEQLLADHVAGAADHSRRIFVLLMLALWHEAFFPGTPAQSPDT